MKRYISEAAVSLQQATSSGLALCQINGRYVLYNPKILLDVLKNRNSQEQSYSEMDAAAAAAILGYIELTDVPGGEAWGASMVRQSAAQKGYGPLMYDIAMSLAKVIISDRDKVSQSASKIWKFYQQRSDIKKLPLDDIKDPKTPDTKDDADVFPGQDELNFAYTGANTDVSALQSNHQNFLKNAQNELQYDQSSVEDALEGAADSFFRKMY